MEDKAKKAEAIFKSGYNCCQSVVLAFADEMGLDAEKAGMIASPFGGGMGVMREVCGAVSGMFMVYGAIKGYGGAIDKPEGKAQGKELYATIVEMADEFKKIHGSIICREMLGIQGAKRPLKEDGTEFKKQPCSKSVYNAAKIVQEFLEKGK